MLDAGEDAGALGADLEVDLLGLELDERLAGGDAVAFLLQPARDARFDDRFTQLRERRCSCHDEVLLDVALRTCERRRACDGPSRVSTGRRASNAWSTRRLLVELRASADEPSDGLELRARPDVAQRAAAVDSSSSSGRTNSHAPMFSGSSCTQTTSSQRSDSRPTIACESLRRERIELLDAARWRRSGCRRAALAATSGRRRPCRCTGRSRAHLAGACRRVGIVDHRLEAALGELARRRRHHRVAQQALRREHDQRQRIGLQQQRLPPQQVEVLRGGRAVGEAQVDVGGQLAGSARGARSSDPGPGLRSRAAAAAPATASCPHLARPDVTNSSRITCAPLMKSPYCASQITSRPGSCTL